MKKEKIGHGQGKAQIVLDSIDLEIYDEIKKNPGITIGEIKAKLNITHPSLIPHLTRLENWEMIERTRDQQRWQLDQTLKAKEHDAFFSKILDRLRENREKLRIK